MSNEVRFLVVRGGPLGDFFETLLSGAGTLVTFDGSQKTEDYDLLVLDGGSLSASAFEKGATAAKAALDANKPVLILTPTTDHKDVLAAAGALRAYPRGGSVALLIEPHRNADDKLSLWLAEQYAPDAGNGRLYRTVGGAGHDEDAAAATSDVFEVQAPSLPSTTGIAPFIERLRGAVSALKAGRLLASASKGPKDPPPDIPSDLYDVTPVNLFYEIKITEHTNPGWFPTGAVRLEGTAYIGVYYDNLHNTPLQWLLIEHSGLFYTGGMEDDDEGGRGWSLGALHIEGPNISSQALATHLSSPNNVNGVRTYSSGTSFTVGIGADTDGLNANLSYEVSSSVTNEISDWGIVQLRPDFWKFAQQSPYPQPAAGFWEYESVGSGPPAGCAGSTGITPLPPISSGSLAYDTQTVWQHLPATKGYQHITYKFRTLCNYAVLNKSGKKPIVTFWSYPWETSKEYTVDWSAAWPKG